MNDFYFSFCETFTFELIEKKMSNLFETRKGNLTVEATSEGFHL